MSSGAGHERGSRTKHTSGRGRLGGCGRGGSFGRGLAAVDIDFSSQNGGAGGWPHAANACDDGGIGSKSVPPIPGLSQDQRTSLWILNFVCSNHMTGRKNLFKKLYHISPYVIGLPNGAEFVALQEVNFDYFLFFIFKFNPIFFTQLTWNYSGPYLEESD